MLYYFRQVPISHHPTSIDIAPISTYYRGYESEVLTYGKQHPAGSQASRN